MCQSTCEGATSPCVDDGRVIRTSRLVLRPWRDTDIDALIRINDDPLVAANTCSITLPYTREKALEGLAKFARVTAEGTGFVRAWCLAGEDEPRGGVGLTIDRTHNNAELGYSTASTHRSGGYTTEACRAMLDHAFRVLGLHRVYARHFVGNVASERVMEKLGMRPEGVQRGHTKKGDVYHDLCGHGILRHEWPGGDEA